MHLYIVLAQNLILFGAALHEGAIRWHCAFETLNCLKLCMGKEEFCSEICILFI